MSKLYDIDPETCTKEELENAIRACIRAEELGNTQQLGAKTFINSCYGALASKFYQCSNTQIAESITLQGQDLIKYSTQKVNEYFKELWTTDEDVHKKIAETLKSKHKDFNVENFLENAKSHLEIGDTLQVYGDSITGDSAIRMEDGSCETIENLFNAYCDTDSDDKIRVSCDKRVYGCSSDFNPCTYPIKYIMRHKTNKTIWRVTSTQKTINVTEDHSIVIVRNNIMCNIKPNDIDIDTDKLIIYDNDKIVLADIQSNTITNLSDEYVYDIEIDSNDAEKHVFFANDILVHNTDSISYDSIIKTSRHPNGITISEWYKENENNIGERTLAGHESVHTDDKALNFDDDKLTFTNVKRIIRHKVSKPKWKLRTSSGKEIVCTDNHSLIVFRNGVKKKVKPSEITCEDKVLTVNLSTSIEENIRYVQSFDNVEICMNIGEYTDEYVYDIEMDDDSHTFIANDILVHNSSYITLQPIIDQCKIPAECETDFVLAINEFVLDDYLTRKFDEYAKAFNCHKNLEKFELEKIARTLIMLAKKKYVMDISWKEPDVHVAPLHVLVFKGIEIIQGSTPGFCRNIMKDFIMFMLEKINNGEKPSYDAIISKLKSMKDMFAMQSPNEISKSFGMNDYEKYILDDKKDIIFTDATTPIHVRAAAVYNNTLFTKAKKYRSKYSIIKKGDKVKFYYTNKSGLEDVFAFLPNEFPVEFAPKMNIDIQFEKMVLEPMNRIIVACGYPSVSGTLMYSASLW